MITPGIYRHFKGKKYRVLGTARHSETLEEYVVYEEMHGKRRLWVRPLEMFCETVEKDGRQVPRFQKVEA